MSHATVDTQGDGDDIRLLLSGEIDLANAAEVEAALLDPITNHSKSVSLDLAKVDYLDSAGLRIIASLAGRLKRSQIEMTLIAPMGSPARVVLELSGLTTLAHLEPSDDEAGDAGEASEASAMEGDLRPPDSQAYEGADGAPPTSKASSST